MKHAAHTLRSLAIALTLLGSMRSSAFARADDDEKVEEARVINFVPKASVDGGTASMWLLSIGLLIVTVGVMFKNANRTHLD